MDKPSYTISRIIDGINPLDPRFKRGLSRNLLEFTLPAKED